MAVTLLSTTSITFNNGTPSGTLSPSASASHLVLALSYPSFDGLFVTAVTVGGVSLTKLIAATNDTNNQANAEIWYLVSPSSTANQTVAVTSAGGWQDFGCVFHSISGASTPTGANAYTDVHDGGTNLNAAMSCAVGDFAVAAASGSRQAGSPGSWANSFVSDLSGLTPNSLGQWAMAHKIAASTTETANIQVDAGANTYSAALASAIFPASGGGGDTFMGQICL